MGLVGGAVGRWVLARVAQPMPPMGSLEEADTTMTACYGANIFERLRGKLVLDFGCGAGLQVVELAQRGAQHVIGLDIQARLLEVGRERAERAGIGAKCTFTTQFTGQVPVILSKDAFEHFGDPAAILKAMAGMLTPDGIVLASFGPTWLHPKGGHAFSVFPWAHLLLSEDALMQWRAQYRSDGARKFSEIDGGLNQLTIRQFERIVARSPLKLEWLESVPIRGIGLLATRPLREFGSSMVRCQLALR